MHSSISGARNFCVTREHSTVQPNLRVTGVGFYLEELHREQLIHTTSNLEVHRWADVIIVAWK